MRAQGSGAAEPWTSAELLAPEVLAKLLESAKEGEAPVVVHVGYARLYRAAHIPGSVFHGPASSAEGIEDLEKWAQGISRNETVVIYCGCCPLERCPNLRPAFEVLHSSKFSRLRVLNLPTSFAADWMGKGYPTDNKR